MASKKPCDYSQEEVNLFLNSIGLGEKIPAFTANAIDGSMLVTLTEEDLTGDLGLTSLQVEKFTRSLQFVESLAFGGGTANDERVARLERENQNLKNEVLNLEAIVKSLQSSQTTTPVAAPTVSNPYVQNTAISPSQYTSQPTPSTAASYGPSAYSTPATSTYTSASPATNPYSAYSPAPAQAAFGYTTYAPAPAPATYTQPPTTYAQPAPQRHGAPVIAGAAGGATKGAILGAIGGAIAGDAGQGAKMGAAMGGAAGGMQGLGQRRRQRLGRRY
mmetsp:Transcript_28444/g.53459  ORF Transcript_28444/g.53459 Transcript_28444/m.53459 type:complete len:275 (-) Transcript_28444:1389-2213(-)